LLQRLCSVFCSATVWICYRGRPSPQQLDMANTFSKAVILPYAGG